MKHTNASRLITGNQTGSMVIYIIFSVLCHAALMAAVITVPALTGPKKIRMKDVVSVSLVSIPAPKSESKTVYRPPKKQPKKKILKKPPEKKKIKKQDKKKIEISTNEIKDAISKLKKEVDEQDPSDLEETLKDLKKEVENQDQDDVIERLKNEVANSRKNGTGTGVGNQSSGGIMDIYAAEISFQIQDNWAYTGEASSLVSTLGLKIAPNGEIVDIWFDRKSGNRHLDNSAYNAIMKSNPLPPLPRAYRKPFYKIGFNFGTKGVKK